MQLDKDTLRKLRGLIIFTLVILVGLWRFSIVLQAVKAILHILFPFLLGGAIAFVLSVPMNRHPEAAVCKRKGKAEKICRARQPDSDADFCAGTIEPCDDCGCAGAGKYHCYAWENTARKGACTDEKGGAACFQPS